MRDNAKKCWDSGVLHLRTRPQAIKSFVLITLFRCFEAANLLHRDEAFEHLIAREPYLGLPPKA